MALSVLVVKPAVVDIAGRLAGDGVASIEPTSKVDLGAALAAKRTMLFRCGLGADRTAARGLPLRRLG